MNPYALTGPQFLLFYLALGGATLLALGLLRGRYEGGETMRVTLSDPYQIAFLRGGRDEALRVATLSLADRGLLAADGASLRVADPEAAARVRRRIERAILGVFASESLIKQLFESPASQQAADELGGELTRVGLLPDEETRRRRRGAFVLALVLLWSVAGLRVLQALSRGRHNVGFLIALAVIFALLVAGRVFQRRTARGDALLQDIRRLFAGLKGRATSLAAGGATAEAALLAAVFGLGALPASRFPLAGVLNPWAGSARASAGACDSSDSSCGSSCGGSCGGGGGCGGCGG